MYIIILYHPVLNSYSTEAINDVMFQLPWSLPCVFVLPGN